MPKWRGLQVKRSWSLAERIEYYSIPEPNSGCILWLGCADQNGYGLTSFCGRKMLAHRAAWELRHGPTDLICMHKCDNPGCINPDHLRLGTLSDNFADMRIKGRHARGISAGPVILKEADVQAIRIASGTHRQIAAQYGVAHGTIGRIKRRTGWKHLPEGAAAIAALAPSNPSGGKW